MSERLQLALALQEKPSLIRNVCVCAHIDHGKTTLTDTLLATNSLISRDSAGKLRFLDFLASEQERCITMKSSSVSLLYNCTTDYVIHAQQKVSPPGETRSAESSADAQQSLPSCLPFLLNVIDTPGHLDFSTEVLSAMSLCDAAFLVVDAVEGVCAQTRTVMRYLVTLGLDIILVVNKLDRLYTEWMMNSYDAFTQLLQVVASVNELYASTKASLSLHDNLVGDQPVGDQGVLSTTGSPDPAVHDQVDSADGENPHTNTLPADYFTPRAGNIVFASALHGWGFSLHSFAAKLRTMFPGLAGKYSVSDLSELLWNPSASLDTQAQSIRIAGKGQVCKAPIFSSIILESLFHIYAVTTEDPASGEIDFQAAKKAYKKLFGQKLPAAVAAKQVREVILKTWLPLGEVLFDAVIFAGQSPVTTGNCICRGVLNHLLTSRQCNEPCPSQEVRMRAGQPEGFVAVCGKLLDADSLDIGETVGPTGSAPPHSTAAPSDQGANRYYALCRVVAGKVSVGSEVVVTKRSPSQRTTARVLGVLLPMGRTLLRYPPGSDSEARLGTICVLELSYHIPHYSVLYSPDYLEESEQLRAFDIGDYISLPKPLVAVAIWPSNITQYANLLQALELLMEVDTSARYEIDKTVGEIVLYISGDVHLDRCCEELDRFLARPEELREAKSGETEPVEKGSRVPAAARNTKAGHLAAAAPHGQAANLSTPGTSGQSASAQEEQGYKVSDVVLQLIEVCDGGANITVNTQVVYDPPPTYTEAMDLFQTQLAEWISNRRAGKQMDLAIDQSGFSQPTQTDGTRTSEKRKKGRRTASSAGEREFGTPANPDGRDLRKSASPSASPESSKGSEDDGEVDLFSLEFQASGGESSKHAQEGVSGQDSQIQTSIPPSQSLHGDPLFTSALQAIDLACEALPETTDVSLDSLAGRSSKILPFPVMHDPDCLRYAELTMGKILYARFCEGLPEKLGQFLSRRAGLPAGLEFLLPAVEGVPTNVKENTPGMANEVALGEVADSPKPLALISRYSLLCLCVPTKECEGSPIKELLDENLDAVCLLGKEPDLGLNRLYLKFSDVPEKSRSEIFRNLSMYCFENILRAGFIAEEPVANVTMICEIRGLENSILELDEWLTHLGLFAGVGQGDPHVGARITKVEGELAEDLAIQQDREPSAENAASVLLKTLTSTVLASESRPDIRSRPAYFGIPSFPTFSSAIPDFTHTMRRAMENTNFLVAEPHLKARVTAGSSVSEADLQRCLARLRCQKLWVEYDSQHAVTMEVSAPRMNCLILPSELRSECSGNVGIELQPGGFRILPDNPQHLDVAATVDEEVEWGASGEHRLTDSSSNSRNSKLSAGASLSRETRFLAKRLSLTGANCHYAGSNVAHRLVSLVRARKGLVLLGGQIVEAEKQRTLKRNR